MREKHYWGYRIDKIGTDLPYFKKELENGRLRQGWGYLAEQDLRREHVGEAWRNRKMFNEVKKGDILLMPRLMDWWQVAILEATDDWDKGYRFEIGEKGDYGHIFPAKFIKCFVRKNEHVTGNIRSTLGVRQHRLWNINKYAGDIEKLVELPKDVLLLSEQNNEDRLVGAVNTTFGEAEENLKSALYEKFNQQFQSDEWEHALVAGLKILFPFYEVQRVGGRLEKHHGTDILVKLPSLFPAITNETNYGIAIQVKDWEGEASDYPISQISKAEDYYQEDGSEKVKLIDKIVIFTKVKDEGNEAIQQAAKAANVKIIFANDLKDLLYQMSLKIMSNREDW